MTEPQEIIINDFPLQVPLMFAVVFGVHFLTGLSIWWCYPIAFVLWRIIRNGS